MSHHRLKDPQIPSPLDNKNVEWAEEQVVFRKMNEELQVFIDEIQEAPVERGVENHEFNMHDTYYFSCECSDENCSQRILMSFEQYEKAHESDDTFVLIPGHQSSAKEKIIKKSPTFWTVQKYKTPR